MSVEFQSDHFGCVIPGDRPQADGRAVRTARDDLEEGVEVGAVWGLRELADGHVFGDDAKFRIAEVIPEGAGAIIALIEHRWAIPVRDAIRRAGGRGVAARWISENDLIELGRTVGPGLLESS